MLRPGKESTEIGKGAVTGWYSTQNLGRVICTGNIVIVPFKPPSPMAESVKAGARSGYEAWKQGVNIFDVQGLKGFHKKNRGQAFAKK